MVLKSTLAVNSKSAWKTGLNWGMYDFANSGYYLVYVVLMFPLYLQQGDFKLDTSFEAKWGAAQGFAVAIAIAIGLLFAKSMDRLGLKKVAPYALLVPGVLSLSLPLLVYLQVSGLVLLMAWVFVQSFYLITLTIYDSSLTSVDRGANSIEISGWAWGWGYAGGLTCMGIMQIGLTWWTRNSAQDFLVGSAFFLIVSAFAAIRLKSLLLSSSSTIKKITHQETPKRPSIAVDRWKLLFVFILIVDGVAVFMSFFSSFALKVAKINQEQMTIMLAALQFLAFPLTGIVTKLGRNNIAGLLKFCGISWLIATLVSVLFPGETSMWIAILVVASTVGTTQALLRSIYAQTTDNLHAVQDFTKYAVVEKGAAFLGPLVAGLLIVSLGHRIVLGGAGLMILVGTLILSFMVSSSDKAD